MVSVALQQLSKTFHTEAGEVLRAVEGLSLSVDPGELLVVLGPSGSGKTTMLRLIAGLDRPDEGTIRIDDRIVNDVPAGERNIGMVFQNDALYPHMTAFENMAFGLKVRGCPRAEREARVREIAETLRITDCLHRRPAQLSGGQRQRVALGRAVVRKPPLLLFDEPFSNADAPLRKHLRAELSRLRSKVGSTAILVTHDQAEALSFGARIALINHGRLAQIGRALELYDEPADLFVAGFLGSPPMNFFRGLIVKESNAAWFQEQEGGADAKSEVRSAKSEVRSAKSEVRSAKSEVRSAKSEVRSPKSEVSGGPALRLRLPGGAAAVAGPVVLGLRPENIGAKSEVRSSKFEVRSSKSEAQVFPVLETQQLGSELLVSFSSASGTFSARLEPQMRVRTGDCLPLSFNVEMACFFDAVTGERLVEG